MIDTENEDWQVYILSDGTGITAQHLAHSLMSQFEQIDFETTTLPYIDTIEKAQATVDKINTSFQKDGKPPIIFATLVNQQIRDLINQSKGHVFDLFHAFLSPLEKVLNTKCSYTIGRSHGLTNVESYQKRIDAVHYALDHDDGIKLKGYSHADLIIIGVSRCGKTPTSLYLAMQFGLKVANYPLTEDDDSFHELPKALHPYQHKLFGITISAERLHAIRHERRPNSHYASLRQCQKEISNVEQMFDMKLIPYINSTYHSIEEMATRILAQKGFERNVI